MANEFWINIDGTTGGWKQADEVWVNITGATTGWKSADEVWVNVDGTTSGWKQVFPAADPAFTASSFASDTDPGSDGTSDNEGCSPCSTYNGWCIKWSVENCTASHQIRVMRNIGSGWFYEDTTASGCTKGQPTGWCTSFGYDGAIDSGDNGTTTCPSVGNTFRLILENSGGGGNYGYAPDSSGWTLATCVV